VYFSRLCSVVEPDIALIVADENDCVSRQPYGLAFFNDASQIRPGMVVMPAGRGDFWSAIVHDLRAASPQGYAKLLEAYPDSAGGVDLQPFLDLITIHELGHAFETLGDLWLPTFWLNEIFVNLATHAFVATQLPASLPMLEVLPRWEREAAGSARGCSPRVTARLRSSSSITRGVITPMSPLNYVWFQYRCCLRLAAKLFDAGGEDRLVRFWDCFHATDRRKSGEATAAITCPSAKSRGERSLGRAVELWR
jgi:hypothetical protein